jgi:hypothetical protein
LDEYQFIHQLTRTSDGADLAFSKSTWI